MPEIKNTFTQGKMNKDLDERVVPNGQYRDALNIQVSTSDGADVGTVQNILGNTRIGILPGDGWECVGSIADEKNDVLYSFIHHDSTGRDAIMEHAKDGTETVVLADVDGDVLNFTGDIITGINVIDEFLLWTDGNGEPKKINIERCKDGTNDFGSHTKLVVDGSAVVNEIVTTNWTIAFSDPTQGTNVFTLSGIGTASNPKVRVGDQLIEFETTSGGLYPGPYGGEVANVTDIDYTTGEVTISISLYNGLGIAAIGNTVKFETYVVVKEEHITVVKKKPLRPLSVKINSADPSNKKPLFEKIFPRFSYRYRYEDGEYSAFAPFTDVVFKSLYGNDQESVAYDSNNAYGIDEPYNNGMRNMISSIELGDFISPGIPEDVVQVDLLYKQENSNVVYILETIENDNAKWEEKINPNSAYKGSFTVTSENIYAALPENQLLRPWDNVPKIAKAQEITGNRVVYGNYTQGYDLEGGPYNDKINPTTFSEYGFRNIENDNFIFGGLPSVKSQRNYQVGVVYGDKYGRETPVFTDEDASLDVPWGNNLASQSLQLKTSIQDYHPQWADYYKFFVKETSGEYYNLVMDAVYRPTKEDLVKDDHIWLSFSSSDRNKISKEDYIILKRKIGEEDQISEENKYKILDIKNEAPDAIKYKYLKLGEVSNFETTNPDLLNDSQHGIFYNYLFRPEAGKDLFHIHKTNWQATSTATTVKANGMSLTENDETTKKDDLFVSWVNVGGAAGYESTERYKVASIRISGMNQNVYIIQLEKPISTEDGVLITAPGATLGELDANAIFKVERKIVKNLEAFSGKFFVKIHGKGIVLTLQDANELQNIYTTLSTQNTHWHADVSTSGAFDPDAGLINNGTYDVTALNNTDETSTIANGGTATTSAPITNTEAGWDNILTSVQDTTDDTNTINQFFIDNMYMAASQPSVDSVYGGFARHSGQGWYGGNPLPVEDIIYGRKSGFSTYWNGGSLPVGYSKAFDTGSSPPHTTGIAWPTDSDITLQTPTTTTSGDNMVNGIPGVIQLTDDHTSITGIRRWKKSIHSTDLTAWDYGNHTSHNGKNIIHLSFLAPGEDLHDIGSGWDSLSFKNLPTKLQGIWGGGVFTKDDGSDFTSDIESISSGWYKKALFCEREYGHTWDGSHYDGGMPISEVDPDIDKPGLGTGIEKRRVGYHNAYEDRHRNQWKPEWSGGTYSATIYNFVRMLKTPGQKFRFKGDEHVYTIKRVAEKRIYNHTPWRRMYKYGNSGLEAMNNSVEEAAITWRETGSASNTSGDQNERNDFKTRVEEFGKANNRRVCYIIHLEDDVFPVAGGTDPTTTVAANSTLNSLDAHLIEFVNEDFNLLEGKISEHQAIWETEPKDSVDLDIYHEAGQAYPVTITEKTRELFAQVGCKVKLVHGNSVNGTNIECELTEWQSQHGGRDFLLDPGFPFYDAGGLEIDYTGWHIRFIREDGSYTTSKLSAETTGNETAVNTRTIFTINSSVSVGMEHGLSWYNCYSFGNGVESDRIRDDFNAMTLTNGVRANTTLDNPYEEEHRKSGLIYSGIYNSKSGVNNLNQFIMAEKITKDLNPTFGSIQKLFSRRISLIAFCEDRVVGITANKNALYNADGNPQLVATNAVLGDANPFVGDYGISKNPESFAKDSYRAYFTDRQRGAVLRLSMDGLTAISEAGMSDWFKDEFKRDEGHLNIIGSYDNYKNDYNLTFDRGGKTYGDQEAAATAIANDTTPPSQTVSFSEDVKGWTSFKSFIPESGVSMSGDYYTFYNGKCWKHHTNESRNSFYTADAVTNLGSSIKFLLNESPLTIKNYNTLNYDGDEGWECDSITTDQQSGTVNSFIEKEGKWFNYISGNEVMDTQAFNFQGIGVASNIESI